MVDGGEQARTFGLGPYGCKTDAMRPQYVDGQTTIGRSGEVGGAIETGPSLAGLGELAAITRKIVAERTDTVDQLAGRVTAIATRISGPYPYGAPSPDPRGDGERPEPRSALDAVHREVVSIREPLNRMDPALRQLSAALDVLERAIG